MVRDRGFEPLTPSVSRKCSTTELTAQSERPFTRNALFQMVPAPIMARRKVLDSPLAFKRKSREVTGGNHVRNRERARTECTCIARSHWRLSRWSGQSCPAELSGKVRYRRLDQGAQQKRHGVNGIPNAFSARAHSLTSFLRGPARGAYFVHGLLHVFAGLTGSLLNPANQFVFLSLDVP